jgi:probable HAF family extracellular repeat protein
MAAARVHHRMCPDWTVTLNLDQRTDAVEWLNRQEKNGAKLNTISKWSTAFLLLVGPAVADAQTYSLKEIGGAGFSASGVNESGQVAGSGPGTTETQAFFTGAMGVGITFLGASDVYSFANAINDSGQVVFTTLSDNLYSGYVSGPNGIGSTQMLNHENGVEPFAINDSGQISGGTGLHYARAFITDPHGVVVTVLDGLTGKESYGYAINASGQITGNLSAKPGLFITGPNGTDLRTLTALSDDSTGRGINTSGQVTGSSVMPGGDYNHAFVTGPNGETVTDLGTLPGDDNSVGYAINDSGQVVGTSSSVGTDNNHAFMAFHGQMVDLNTLIDSSDPLQPYVILTAAIGITDGGYIAANGTDGRFPDSSMAFLLTPEIAPSVNRVITGTLGQNGWYDSKTTTLAWAVTGRPTPAISGCGVMAVPQNAVTTYTCVATNSLGAASDSVTIKEDSVAPTVVIKRPGHNAIFTLNQKVPASYSCNDVTSGVATCSGDVADGTGINTSAPGSHTFSVVATDKAGNTVTKSVNYTVN